MAVKDLTHETGISDQEVVNRVRAGDTYLFEIIMRRYNQRIFRVIRAILRDDHEAEEVMQEAYVRAFEHLGQFEGRSKFSTWLTKIAVYEAYARTRSRERLSDSETYWEDLIAATDRSPEQRTFDSEMRSLLENAVDSLSDEHRAVFMLRDIEGMSTLETAEALNISEENVKIRLFRARAALRRELIERVGTASMQAFQFLGARCDRTVEQVLERINQLPRR
jgi:RNA polymerase sigma-70 factor (ECF subfamily)